MPKRVVIVGGGIIGLASAYYLQQAGHEVVIVDRNPPARDGCSFGNSGLVVPSHFIPLAAPGMIWLGLKMMWNPESPFYIRPRLSSDFLGWVARFCWNANAAHVERSAPTLLALNLASRQLYVDWAKEMPNAFDFDTFGLYMLCKSNECLHEEAKVAEQARRLGLATKVLDAKELTGAEPGIKMDVAGAVYFPADCQLNPRKFATILEEKLLAGGAEFHWQRDATGFAHSGKELVGVVTREETIRGDEFVLAGGAWSGKVGKMLSLRLPMQAGRGYSLTLDAPKVSPNAGAILVEARVAVTPMGGKLRFGGTMEIAGLETSINPRRIAGIVKSIPKYYPEFSPSDFAGIEPWVGLRPVSADGLPYLGRSKRWQNLVVATGHSMMGLSLGPITGKLVSELVDSQPTSVNIERLSPDRFA